MGSIAFPQSDLLRIFPLPESDPHVSHPGDSLQRGGRFDALGYSTALAVARHPGDYHSHLSPRWPTCRGRLQPPEEFARTGPNRRDDVASRKRWRGLLSPYSVCPKERSRCQDRPVRGLERRCPSCAEYMTRANHTVCSSNNSYFRVPTRGRIWNNGQRTLHPISRPISLPTGAGRSPPLIHRQRCYTHFRRHKINCSCA